MLKKIRVILAVFAIACTSLLFLDFTGAIHKCLGWLAEIQLVPAILALNFGVIIFLALLTLLFGRLYCSIICPLGIYQDLIAKLNKILYKRKSKKLPYSYSPAKSILRYSFLGLFIIAMVLGVSAVVSILSPYAAYGRIANNFYLPIWQFGNNILAYFAERADSYAFYETEIWIKSIPTFVLAAVTLILVTVLAMRSGRTYCNTICPVGTFLGLVSKFSIFKITLDKEKCNNCSVCSKVCKSSCIDYKNHSVDHSRCVACMNCIGKCHKNAIEYKFSYGKKAIESNTTAVSQDKMEMKEENKNLRRSFIAVGSLFAYSAVKAQAQRKVEMKMDGGLALIVDKVPIKRKTKITPPGSLNDRNMNRNCNACQLCVTACPNGVLKPSTSLSDFMQPSLTFEKGYCRPECTKCSEVCPSNAISPINDAEKSSIKIGTAKWIPKHCVVATKDVDCGNCARHCPNGAIQMVKSNAARFNSRLVPAIDPERCIGCGACEYVCPARPNVAIYVEGVTDHRFI